jgi:hypothetical protein
MKFIKILIFSCFFLSTAFAQNVSTLKDICEQNKKTWPKTLTYAEEVEWTQYVRTENYTNYFALSMPDMFRYDMRNIDDGNSNLFIRDTMYVFKSYKKRSAYKGSEIIDNYIFGRIYSDPFDKVITEFKKVKIDVTKNCKGSWNGKKVIIIGSSTANDVFANQIWYDAVNLYPVRILLNGGRQMSDAQFEQYFKQQNSWFPAVRKEYAGKKLIRNTKYTHVQKNIELSPLIFDPNKFGSYHWLKTYKD